MRKIICLRVEIGMYAATYRVGETPAGGSQGEFVEKIEVKYIDMDDSGTEILLAQVTFANGETRCFPVGPGISWDIAPEDAE